jgi:hypothetical protein
MRATGAQVEGAIPKIVAAATAPQAHAGVANESTRSGAAGSASNAAAKAARARRE